MSYDLGTAHGKIDLDYEGGREAAKAEEDIENLRRKAEAADKQISKFGQAMGKVWGIVTRLGKGFAITSAGVSALVGSVNLVVSAVAALAPVIAATVAVLPGLLLVAGAAAGVLKLALAGVGDALKAAFEKDPKAFNEALKNLAPSAQRFAKAFREVLVALRPVQKAIQNTFFAGLDKQVLRIGKGVKSLQDDLQSVALGFNRAAAQVLRFAGSKPAIDAVRSSLVGLRDFLDKIVPGIYPLLTAFAGLAGQAGLFGDTVGDKVLGAMLALAAAIERVNLAELFAAAEPVLRSLWGLLRDLNTIFQAVFGSVLSEGQNAFGILGELVNRLAVFLQTAEGSAALDAFGESLRAIASAGGDTFLALLQALGPAVILLTPGIAQLASQISKTLVTALEAAAPALAAMSKFLSDNMNWIGPVAIAIVGLTAAYKAYTIAQAAATIAMGIWNGAAKIIPALTKAWAAAQWLLNAAMLANPIVLIIAAVALLIAAIVLIATRTTWFQTLWTTVWGAVSSFFIGLWQNISSAVAKAWEATLNFFQSLPGKILDLLAAFPGLLLNLFVGTLNGVAYAVGFGIGLIIKLFRDGPSAIMKALKSLGSLLLNLFKNAISSAHSATVTGIARLVSFLLAFPGRARDALSSLRSVLLNAITTAFTAGRNAFNTGVASVVALAKSLPGKIKNGIGDLSGLLRSAGADLIRGLINGINSLVDRAADIARAAAKRVADGIKDALRIGSPSKLTFKYGAWTTEGLMDGLGSLIGKLGRMSRKVAMAALPVVPTASGNINPNTVPRVSVSVPATTPVAAGITFHQTVNALPGMNAADVASYASRRLLLAAQTGTFSPTTPVPAGA